MNGKQEAQHILNHEVGGSIFFVNSIAFYQDYYAPQTAIMEECSAMVE
jgi:hypothetical protein